MRILAVAVFSIWIVQCGSASAQSFDDRWSVIPKAHAEQPPPAAASEPQQQQSRGAEETKPRSEIPESERTFYGRASFYSYRKGKTASGSPFNREMPTAAHRTLPFGTKLRVTNLANHKSVIVTITDRGPKARGRVLDVSLAAARTLEMLDKGVAKVRVEVL